MSLCDTRTQTWIRNIKIGTEFKQYTVQLVRLQGCVGEEYQIFVNDQQLESHGLTFNPCSPLCCSGGEFEWKQDGHTFLLTYYSRRVLAMNARYGKFRLFVDGIDVNTNEEYSAFWRKSGYIKMVVAAIIFIIGVAWFLIFRYAVHSHYQRIYIIAYAFAFAGILHFIKGIIEVLKFRKPRYCDRMPIEPTPNTV